MVQTISKKNIFLKKKDFQLLFCIFEAFFLINLKNHKQFGYDKTKFQKISQS